MKLYNVSTGKLVKGGSCKTAGAVLCLTFEPTGSQLWVGDSKVCGNYCTVIKCLM